MNHSRFYDSAKFGNVVTFTPPKGPIPPWSSTYPDIVAGGPNPILIPDSTQPLLEVDLSGEKDSSGSWVLTIDHEATFRDQNGDPAGNGVYVVPLVATVSLGTGGSQQTFQTDCKNQSFQVPGANIKVSCNWDTSIPANSAAFFGGNNWQFPTKVEVRASIQRGFSTGIARRTQLLPSYGVAPAQPFLVVGKIPNFATCFRVWGDRNSIFFQPDPVGGSVTMWAEAAQGGSSFGGKLIQYFGPNLVNPSGVPVPAHAQNYFFSGGGAGLYALEWDLKL